MCSGAPGRHRCVRSLLCAMKTPRTPTPGLLAWQWSLYASGHCDRLNLLVHAVTVPCFLAGTVMLVAAPLVSVWLAVIGAVCMLLALALQGAMHRREPTQPVPARGPFDLPIRLLTEQ